MSVALGVTHRSRRAHPYLEVALASSRCRGAARHGFVGGVCCGGVHGNRRHSNLGASLHPDDDDGTHQFSIFLPRRAVVIAWLTGVSRLFTARACALLFSHE